jgi:pimeloyl-ACP methyl ester carboxylesterase
MPSRRHGAFVCLCLLLACAARAAQPWQELPSTPALPANTVAHYAQLNGARIWYSQWGSGNAGVPVLLLHGGYANSNYFAFLIPVLVSHGYRVIAMDSRGHGRSTRTRAPITYDLMAEDVLALLDLLGFSKVSLVGWSDGACIGFDLGIHHSERLARLFSFGGSADRSGAWDDAAQAPTFAAYFERVRTEYRQLSPTPSDWKGFDASMSRMWATSPNFTRQQLQTISVATTIAEGQYEEAIKPEHYKYLAATIPHARLVILPNVSHFAMLQNPAAFNAAVLEFLMRP